MDHLLQAAFRSVLVAAFAGLGIWRVRAASIRHAVWTLVNASMLLQIALIPVLPEIPLRMLRPLEPVAITVSSQVIPAAEPGASLKSQAALSWEQIAAAVYFCGLIFFVARLVFALRFAQRLVHDSEPAGPGISQSGRISAPLTIGNRILLPLSWSGWDSAKLRAVLAHEEAHVSRRDWAIALMARLNRCVFWFHPLAWWLERQLARLAEQACDDAALAIVQDREQYARTLLEVARAIQFSRGRVLSAPMAKEANVETRINRILDETRHIPKALGRRGWVALAVFAAPLIYIAAAIQLAPAQTPVISVPQPAPPPPPAPAVTIAQVPAPPPAPVVTIAQAPAPPATPAPPPQDNARQRFEEERQLKELERSLQAREAALQALESAQEVQQAQGQGDLERMILDLNREIAEVDARVSQAAMAMRQIQVAQAQTPQPQGRVELFNPTGAGAPVQVDVKTVRTTVISIPLDPTQQYDVIGKILTQAGNLVTSFDERADYRRAFEKNVPLKDGKYVLTILLRTRDGKTSTKETNFEVK